MVSKSVDALIRYACGLQIEVGEGCGETRFVRGEAGKRDGEKDVPANLTANPFAVSRHQHDVARYGKQSEPGKPAVA